MVVRWVGWWMDRLVGCWWFGWRVGGLLVDWLVGGLVGWYVD
jgi:hypothetical protein